MLTANRRGIGREPATGEEIRDRLARELASWHALDAGQGEYRLDRLDGR